MEDKNISQQIRGAAEWLRKLWQKEEIRCRILVLMGLAGMVLILISGMGKTSPKTAPEEISGKELSPEEYVLSTERRLENIIRQIENVGECSVMLTLKQGRENIYASEGKTGQEDLQETKLVLLKNREGSEALIEKTVEPQIKGVIVVCRGAKSASVRQQVTEAVTTVLGIRSTQVWVCPRSRFK